MVRDGWRCRRCQSRENLTLHHIVRRSEGGSDTPKNLIALCRPCHDALERGEWELDQSLLWKLHAPGETGGPRSDPDT